MTLKEMEKKAGRIKILNAQRDSIDTEIEALKAELTVALEMEGVDVKQAGPFKISWKLISSNRFDSKRFKADHLDIYNLYNTQTQSRRFQVN